MPYYWKMIRRLEEKCTEWGYNSPLGLASKKALDKLSEYYTGLNSHSHLAIATICDLRFNFNVFRNLWQDLDSNAHRNRVRKQFIDTFVQYKQREKALQAAVIAKQDESTATIDDDIAIHLDSDSEDDLFKPRGIPDFEAEYTKWIKQPVIKRETNILKY